VISPLLANIALHGMETALLSIKERWGKAEEKPILIRYADDYVILHSNKEVVEQCSKRVESFLRNMGLWLNDKKTRMTHTLTSCEGNVGFDFLGFTIRQYPVGKYRTGTCRGKPLGFKTIIKPAKEAVKRHMKAIGDAIRKYGSVPQEKVIAELNPKIRGWANYYKTVVAKKTLSQCDHILWRQLWRWGIRRHTNKGAQWVKRKYWKKVGKRDWVFSTPDEKLQCQRHGMTSIQRHIKVIGTRSPYDGDFTYWAKRLSNHPMLHKGIPYLLKKQKGICRMCNLSFKDGDLIEIDHITPRSCGGKDEPSNLMALHRHCHDKRHHDMSKAGIRI
jgi:RNA-directed DNA polymerase